LGILLKVLSYNFQKKPLKNIKTPKTLINTSMLILFLILHYKDAKIGFFVFIIEEILRIYNKYFESVSSILKAGSNFCDFIFPNKIFSSSIHSPFSARASASTTLD